jgi:type IV pilus assembly protein PilE
MQKMIQFFKKHLVIEREEQPSANYSVDAFSLPEILIVLAIIGILIMLVVPNQAGVASRTKSLEAQQELKMVQNLEYAYFLQFSKYANDLNAINYIPHKTVVAGGTANYEVSILEATPTGFRAKAEAVQDFDGDGTKNIWEIDQDGVLKETQPD